MANTKQIRPFDEQNTNDAAGKGFIAKDTTKYRPGLYPVKSTKGTKKTKDGIRYEVDKYGKL